MDRFAAYIPRMPEMPKNSSEFLTSNVYGFITDWSLG